MQRHEEVINALSRDIFTRKLASGFKLPSERQLALDMEIDRTSLRVALKHLESMGLLDIRHGDGIYIRDFLKHAGPDFLQRVVCLEDEEGQPPVVDEYTLDEMWEFWSIYFPAQLKLASKRVSSRNIKDLMDLLDEQLLSIDDRDRVLELDILAEDGIAEATNNMVIMLYSNSSRPIRRRMIKAFYDRIDDETLKRHVEIKRMFVREFLSGSVTFDEIADKYAEVLEAHRHAIKRQWTDSDAAAKMTEMVEQYKDTIGEAGHIK